MYYYLVPLLRKRPDKIILHVRYSLPPHIEILFFELNLRNRKWLVCCSYNPHKNLIKGHLRVLTEGIQFYSKDYENILLMGDYNAEITETNMSSFCEIYHLTNIIKQPTCFKNPSNPSCIDLFLTNNANCFQKSSVFETGLSDFHKLIVTVMKSHIPKQQPKIIKYRNYKGFNETKFRSELTNILDLNIHESRNIEFFKNIFLKVLNKHAPIKTKYLRANHSPFVTKELSKAIMLRLKLRNQYLKYKSKEARARFKIQRNLCVTLLRKTKRDYYENLDLGNVDDSKKFWNTVKPLFGTKVTTRNNITLIDNKKVVTSEIESAKIFNKYFVDIVPKLGIKPISTIIKKYKNHPSIIAYERSK